jgi:hypothetical protein
MKFYRLLCAFLPVFFLLACEQVETESRYDNGKPVKVVIRNLSVPFVPGTELLVGLNISQNSEFEARGNGLVDSGGTAEISLHYPTGIAFHGYDSDNSLYILQDYATRKILYRTKNNFSMDYNTTILSFDFPADFEASPP